eukprot:3482715-Pyramimonas_sp.AAC.1
MRNSPCFVPPALRFSNLRMVESFPGYFFWSAAPRQRSRSGATFGARNEDNWPQGHAKDRRRRPSKWGRQGAATGGGTAGRSRPLGARFQPATNEDAYSVTR